VKHTNLQALISCYRVKTDNKELLKSDRLFHKSELSQLVREEEKKFNTKEKLFSVGMGHVYLE
jgi:hypothetical protein